MAKSTYLCNKLLDHMLGTASYTMPSPVYVALFNGDPKTTGTEITGNAYARQSIAFSAASGSSAANSGVVNFPTPTPSGWGTVTHFALFDAASGGNRLRSGALTSTLSVNAGDTVSIAAGAITVTES